MKFRVGFVSNSSSSSYVIVGKRVSPDDARLTRSGVVIIGEALSEGYHVIFARDKDVFDFCKANKYLRESPWIQMTDFFDVANLDIDDYENTERLIIEAAKKCALPGDKAFRVKSDDHGYQNLSDLQEQYQDKDATPYDEFDLT